MLQLFDSLRGSAEPGKCDKISASGQGAYNAMKTEKDVQVTSGENQIVVYQPNETIRLDVRLENETMWLTQAQLCELFQRDVSVISRHIKNVFAEGELEKESNLHFLQIANSDRPVTLYSLDVIISVGYRVKSVIGTRFRQWANKVLKEYILHGYAINDRIERLEQKVLKHDEQINLVLQTALPPIQGVFYDGQLWDARALVLQLIARAKRSLILIDNWATPEVLDLFARKRKGVGECCQFENVASGQFQFPMKEAA